MIPVFVSLVAAMLTSLVLHVIILRLISRKPDESLKGRIKEQKGQIVFKREFTETKVEYEVDYLSEGDA
ncbi:MAG: hypothetical protein J5845_06020 [Lachnospiraceae bacterium]|nr:hypothetical protein [Lachnospiraceae bacterium]